MRERSPQVNVCIYLFLKTPIGQRRAAETLFLFHHTATQHKSELHTQTVHNVNINVRRPAGATNPIKKVIDSPGTTNRSQMYWATCAHDDDDDGEPYVVYENRVISLARLAERVNLFCEEHPRHFRSKCARR